MNKSLMLGRSFLLRTLVSPHGGRSGAVGDVSGGGASGGANATNTASPTVQASSHVP